MTNSLHVVFGAGQIGTRVANLLLARGHRVRMVSRNPTPPAGVERLPGDAREPTFAATAARGAAVVYDCMNPMYQHWRRDLLTLGKSSLHAARANHAALVALDCLYMYGAPAGPMTESTPVRPCSKKGVLRAQLAELRLSALERGELRVAIARASDFFGTGLTSSWWSPRLFNRVFAGKPGEILGDPDQPHSYTYADDVARALVELGCADDAAGVWHVPTVAAESTRQLGVRLGRALGTPIEMARMSPLLLRALGIVAPFMRQLPELAYQWEQPFIIDDRKFRNRFQLAPTPIEQQVAEVAAWARTLAPADRAAA